MACRQIPTLHRDTPGTERARRSTAAPQTRTDTRRDARAADCMGFLCCMRNHPPHGGHDNTPSHRLSCLLWAGPRGSFGKLRLGVPRVVNVCLGRHHLKAGLGLKTSLQGTWLTGGKSGSPCGPLHIMVECPHSKAAGLPQDERTKKPHGAGLQSVCDLWPGVNTVTSPGVTDHTSPPHFNVGGDYTEQGCWDPRINEPSWTKKPNTSKQT